MKIGLIVKNEVIQKYELDEVENLVNSNYEITKIFSERKKLKKRNKFLDFIKNIYKNGFFALIIIEQKIAGILNNKHSFLKRIRDLQTKINIFNKFPTLSKSKVYHFESKLIEKNFYGFSDEMIEIIRKECDVIILLGYNKIIHKDYLKIAKEGILSFHTANIKKYRGRPAGFHEFINNEDFGGVTLQILEDKIDNGKIVDQREISIKNCRSYEETLFMMMKLKKDIIITGLKKIEDKEVFLRPDTKIRLSRSADSKRLLNVYKCLKKTIKKRYLQY